MEKITAADLVIFCGDFLLLLKPKYQTELNKIHMFPMAGAKQ
jgi:hypothetical protein